MPRAKNCLLALVVVLCGVLLAACGSSPSPTTTTTPPTTTLVPTTGDTNTTSTIDAAAETAVTTFLTKYETDVVAFKASASAANATLSSVASHATTFSQQVIGLESALSVVQWPDSASSDAKALITDLGNLNGALLTFSSEPSDSASTAVLTAASSVQAGANIIAGDFGLQLTN